jgi:hypothetical protein
MKATIVIYMLEDYYIAKNMIQLVNTISLCRIMFCFVLCVVLMEMC